MQKQQLLRKPLSWWMLGAFVAAMAAAMIVSLFMASSAKADVEELAIRPAANEASGMVASRKHKGVFWWHRDGGKVDTPRAAIYAMRFDANGNLKPVKGTNNFPYWEVTGAKNSQWEDMALDEQNNIWIGEIGVDSDDCLDTDQKILKMKEPDPLGNESIKVDAWYKIQLPAKDAKKTIKVNGKEVPCKTANAESMFWFDGNLYVFNKWDTTSLYRVVFPSSSGQSVSLVKMGVLGGGVRKISGSSISDDRQRMVVEHYGRFYVYESSNSSLRGDAFVKDMISRKWRWDGRFLCDDEGKGNPGCDGRVEGVSFARDSYDIAFVAEDRRIYYAKPSNYGDKSGSGPSTPSEPNEPNQPSEPTEPTPPPPTSANCEPTSLLMNPCRPWLGAGANTYDSAPIGNYEKQVQEHEKVIGRKVEIAHTYNSVGKNTLNSDDKYFINRANTILYKNWKPAKAWKDAGGSNSTINSGIDTMAKSIKSYAPKKIFLTIHHEPENDTTSGASGCSSGAYKGKAGAGGTPAEYRAMWANVRKRFDAQGVNNVVWAMNHQNVATFNCMVDDLWPGNNLIDWVWFNAYGYGKTGETYASAEGNIRRFQDLLGTYQSSTRDYHSKPWGIIEWNVHDMPASVAHKYYDDMKALIEKNTFPRLKAFVVYDAIGANGFDNRIAYTDGTYDETRKKKYVALAQSSKFKNPTTQPPAGDTQAPTTPTGLNSTEQTTNSIKLAWNASTDNVGVSGYIVKRNGVEVARTAATTYNSTGLTANTAYSYTVSAYDASNNVSDPTGAITVATKKAADTQAPTTPEGFKATAASSTQINLSWIGSTDNEEVTGYIVQRGGVTIAELDEGTVAYNDTGLTPATAYSYAVRAKDAAGNVSAAATASATTKAAADTQSPSVPSGLKATATQTSVNLTWNASSDNVAVKEYVVYRDDSQLAVVTSTTYGDATVTPGTTYKYSVAARDAAGNTSAKSATAQVTVPDVTPTPSNGGLAATYYPTKDLSGVGVSRTDKTVDFDWGDNAPLTGDFPSDNFSVRWTGRVTPTSTNSYTFYTQSDDGVRLWVDGELLIDDWTDHGLLERSGKINLEKGKAYNIKLEYYDTRRGATVKLLWSSSNDSKQIIPQAQLQSDSHAVSATFFSDKNLTNVAGSRIDDTVDFSWGGSPAPGVPADGFGIRWTGKVYAPKAGTYTFYTQNNDGVRLWINGQQLINDWTNHGTLERSGKINLSQGKNDLRLDFYDNTGGATAKLLWSGPGIDKQIIPKGRLYDR